MKNNPIGIFDSGVGGLSVWKEIIKLLPTESILYFADSGNCPYGNKTEDEIINLSKKIVDFFITKGVKLVVVACNTATAAAIDFLRSNYDIPFVGMEPAVKPAAVNTKKGIVGVLATEGTFNGRLFNNTTEKWASDIQIEIQVGKGFVELVENGELDSDKAKSIVEKVVRPMLDRGIDQLVLACTHYPFLCESIKSVSEESNIEIINPAPAVAKQVQNILEEQNRLTDEFNILYEFYTSGKIKTLKFLVNKILPNEKYLFQKMKL